MADINDSTLLSTLPQVLRRDDTAAAVAQSIDAAMQRIGGTLDRINLISRPDTWTDEETNELAWQYHVDFYDPMLPLEQRRELVQNSIRWHRHKGTDSAVEELITTLFGSGRVDNWYVYGGDPGYFQVVTDNPDVTTDRATEFIQALNSVKRLSAWLDSVVLEQTETMPIYYGFPMHVGETMQI
ncbi:phage tail protein I [Saccharibacillus sp. O16]|nr:phage tail protein I [Saccharibacillus sp. O16]